MEKFLARRLYGRDEGVKGGSRPAIIIATAGIAVGLTVMILTLAITRGFKSQIRDKVMGFSQHITVTNSRIGLGVVEDPVECPDSVFQALLAQSTVERVQPYVNKPCIIRTDEAFHGFMLKGIGDDYDRTFLDSYMLSGGFPQPQDSLGNNWIVLSRNIADMLGLDVGSRADVYFMQDQVRIRRLTVTGVYETGFLEYDRMFGITGIRLLQRLNDWEPYEYSGLEIGLTDVSKVDEGYGQVREVMNAIEEQTGDDFLVRTLYDTHSGLFAWLDVLDLNVWIILALMLALAPAAGIFAMAAQEYASWSEYQEANGLSDFTWNDVTDAIDVVLTQAGGVTLKDIQSIDYSWGEIDFEYRPMRGNVLMECCEAPMAKSYSLDIEPDDIDVSDTVTVVWEIG